MQLPYAHQKHNLQGHIFGDIKAGKPPAKEPLDLTPDGSAAWGILADCWTHDPNRRPGATVLHARLKTLIITVANSVKETQQGQNISNGGETLTEYGNFISTALFTDFSADGATQVGDSRRLALDRRDHRP